MTSKDTSLHQLISLLINRAESQRIIVAIAGPPASGKTTFSQTLCDLINEQQNCSCAILPMDGYHFDDGYLKQQGWLPRKGAPHTFDVGGLDHMLARLRSNNEEQVAVPLFDRTLEVSRAGARMISSSTNIVLTEGNYLLLDEQPWQTLDRHFDITVMLKTSMQTLRQRLIERWVGFGYSNDEIEEKIDGNDLENAQTVLDRSREAAFILSTEHPL